jgi:hypothetical protein
MCGCRQIAREKPKVAQGKKDWQVGLASSICSWKMTRLLHYLYMSQSNSCNKKCKGVKEARISEWVSVITRCAGPRKCNTTK